MLVFHPSLLLFGLLLLLLSFGLLGLLRHTTLALSDVSYKGYNPICDIKVRL